MKQDLAHGNQSRYMGGIHVQSSLEKLEGLCDAIVPKSEDGQLSKMNEVVGISLHTEVEVVDCWLSVTCMSFNGKHQAKGCCG